MLTFSISRILSIFVTAVLLFSAVCAGLGSKEISNEDNLKINDFVPDEKMKSEPEKEIISMRTPTTKFFDMGDGVAKARIWTNPIHFENEQGELVDFETSLRSLDTGQGQYSGYDVGVTENTLQALFDLNYNSIGTSPVKFSTRDGSYLTWKPGNQDLMSFDRTNQYNIEILKSLVMANKISSSVSDNVIEYNDVYVGITERYTIGTGKIKHDYIIQSRENIAGIFANIDDTVDKGLAFSGKLDMSSDLIPYIDDQPLNDFELPMTTTSGIFFKDRSTGDVKHYLPPPSASEQRIKMNAVRCYYVIDQLKDGSLMLSVLTPASWLLDDDRTYPVEIDPNDIVTIQPGAVAGKDTFISDGPNENFNVGADESFWITLESSSSYVKARPIMMFDITTVPTGKEIIKVSLKLNFYDDANSDQNSITVHVYPLTRDWAEGTGTTSPPTTDGACWLYYDGTNSWTTSGGDYNSGTSSSTSLTTYGTYTWDVKSHFDSWYSSSSTNYGFILKGESGSDSVKYLYTSDHATAANRPILEVELLLQAPPQVKAGAISSLNINEDSGFKFIDLNTIFEDPNSDAMTFMFWTGTWTAGPMDVGNISVAIETNETLRIKPLSDQYGTDALWLKAADSTGLITHKLTVTTLPVADPPKLMDPVKWNIGGNMTYSSSGGNHYFGCDEDVGFYLQVMATDPDEGDTLTYALNSANSKTLPADLKINSATGEIKFIPVNADVDEYQVTITVNDQTSKMDSVGVTITIDNTDDRPYFKQIKVGTDSKNIINRKVLLTKTFSAYEDEMYEFTLIVHDDDIDIGESDYLTFYIEDGPESLDMDDIIVDDYSWTFFFMPSDAEANAGFALMNISVTDNVGGGIDDWVIINVSVINENDLPVITKVNGVMVPKSGIVNMGSTYADEYTNVTVTATDADLEPLTCETNNPLINVIEDGSNKWILSYKPPASDEGDVSVIVTVYDEREFAEITLDWTVLPPLAPPNIAPVIKITTTNLDFSIGGQIVIEGTWLDKDNTKDSLLFMFELTDPDGGYVLMLPAAYDITVGDGTWKISIDTSQLYNVKEGTYNFEVTATDFYDSDSQSVSIELRDNSLGQQSKTSKLNTKLTAIIVVIIIVIIVALVATFFFMKKKKVDEEQAMLTASPMFNMPVSCPTCSAQIPAGVTECMLCGTARPTGMPQMGVMPVMCTACGTQNPAGSPACGMCGTPLMMGAQQMAVPQQQVAAAAPMAGLPTMCTTCGAGIPSNYSNCPSCGAAVMGGAAMMQQQQQMTQQMPQMQQPAQMQQMPQMQQTAAAPMLPAAQTVACPACGTQHIAGTAQCTNCGTFIS